ncbi:site-specific integrase [Variovorax sp. H27-G14]|uniref:tyrosine-type recombinase/integrase n=1 Tax=Variovorax sp. H27-G14 TaxID=3111914 RepID=UPI0038FCECCA
MAAPKKTAQGTWRVQLEIGGIRDSGTFDTKREADDWNARRTIELRTERKKGPGANRTLLELFREYSEKVTPKKRGNAKETIRLLAFEDAAQHKLPLKKRVHEVTSEELGRWRDDRLKKNQPATVLRDMGLMSAVFEHAKVEWKWITTNPMRDVRRPQTSEHRERVITGPEVRRMLRQLGHGKTVRTVSQAIAGAFLFALATGMRAGEICKLRWIDVRGDYAVLTHTKTKTTGRHVPLGPMARAVAERMKGWDDVMVFGLQVESLDTLFRKARKKAGLEGFTFHDSRHTACTHLAQRINVLDLCKMMGWVKTTQALVYYNPKASDIARRIGAAV